MASNYDEAVMSWRANLSTADVRSMASEYLRGIKTPENIDAYAEYLYRNLDRDEAQPPSRRKRKKRRKG